MFALAYFFFPRVFRRRMNEVLGQIHFWLNVTAFLVLLALPIYFNLIFHSASDEAKLGRIFRAAGSSVASVVLGIEILAAVQILFLANAFWSVFKGEMASSLTMLESSANESLTQVVPNTAGTAQRLMTMRTRRNFSGNAYLPGTTFELLVIR